MRLTSVYPNALYLGCPNFIHTGSLFNHSDSPNVSYSIDTATESIRYTTARAVEPDEELCIFYGSNLWFKPTEIPTSEDERTHADTDTGLVDDDWGGLSAVASEASSSKRVLEDMPNPNEILPDVDLPFTRVKLTSDEDDEETSETVRTGEHVPHFPARLLMPNTSTGMGRGYPRPTAHNLSTEVDISLQSSIPPHHSLTSSFPTFRWLKSSGLDTPTLSHLKRVRKSPTGTHSTLLLTSTSPTVPELPPDLDLAPPYQRAVPRSAALTPTSLALKNALWPTVFAPRRKGEPEDWSRARAQWACAAMLRVVEEARAARAAGEVRMCLPALYLGHTYLILITHRIPILSCPSSFPSRRTSHHRRRSPHGPHTSRVTRASPPHTLCATQHSTSCVHSLTRLPPPPPPHPPPPLPSPHLHPLRCPRQHRLPHPQRTVNTTCSRHALSSRRTSHV